MAQTIRINKVAFGSEVVDTHVYKVTYIDSSTGEETTSRPAFVTAKQIRTGTAVVVVLDENVQQGKLTCQSGKCFSKTFPFSWDVAATSTPTPTAVTDTPTPTPTYTTTPAVLGPTDTPTPTPTDTNTPTPTVTTTITPTPTNLVEEYYALQKCIDNSIARTANTTAGGSFQVNDIVVDGSGAYYIVTGVTNNISNNIGTVSATGLPSCPAAPTEYQPSVTTLGETDLGTTSATLNGTISDVGNPNYTVKGFVYVQGTGTPTLANTVINVSGTASGNFNAPLTGLTPGQGYTYRAYATNSIGTTYGDTRLVTANLVGYYQLQDCSTLSTNHRSQQTIEELALGNSDRVTAGGTTYIVVGSTNDVEIPSVGTVTDTGLQGCPATERYYNYEECDGGGITGVAKWPSGTSLSNGQSFFNGQCFRITTETSGPNFGDFDLTGYDIYNDCTECNGVNNPTPTPTSTETITPTPTGTETVTPTPTSTSTPTPTPTSTPEPSYYLFDECEGAGQVVAQIVAPLDVNLRYVDFTVSPAKYYTYTGNSVNPAGYTVNNNLQPTGNTDYDCPSVATVTPPPATYTTNPGSSTSLSGTGTNSLTFTIAVGSSPFTFKAKMIANTGSGTANVTLAINGETITTGTQSLSASAVSNITTVGSITLPANGTYTAVITLNANSSGGLYSTVGQLVEA